jgi:N-methylhydantoinase A
MTKYRVSMDIGGTFTDFVIHDEERDQAYTGKVLSTPDDPARGVMTGLTELVDDLHGIEFLVHGTTVGLNAFLERRGTRLLLITTDGFADVYTIARGDRKKLFDLHYRKPEPLIPPRDVHTVRERLRWDGSVQQELREEDLDPIVEKIQREDIGAVAVCFLHSYLNPEHELRVRDVLRDRVPGLSVSLSHEIAREWREYERASSALLNGYIAPIVQRYLTNLQGQVSDRGVGATLHVMQSNGGIMTAAAARDLPIQTLLSGPVGGTIGSHGLNKVIGRGNLLCVDMGGTSFDASLIVEGNPRISTETALEGLPILMSVVDIHTIGAGGGSLAWLEAGALRVGPRSAGADPGPACYGRGGTEPTVTDANLFLGRMNPEYFLGGGMKLDPDASRTAVNRVAEQLNLGEEDLAEGMLAIINAKMADAMRTITVKQGIDPREYTLVAFGGAGPMHAVALAQELEITEIVIPWAPGTFSAWGMLQTDIRHDLTRTFYKSMSDASPQELGSIYSDLELQGTKVLEDEHVPGRGMRFLRTADMRYIGQEYFVNVPVPAGDAFSKEAMTEVTSRFHSAYETQYGHSTPGAPVEFVNLRVAALGEVVEHKMGRRKILEERPSESDLREVVFDGEAIKTAIWRRERLPADETLPGPLVIEEETATTVVPPNWTAAVDEYDNIIITPERG